MVFNIIRTKPACTTQTHGGYVFGYGTFHIKKILRLVDFMLVLKFSICQINDFAQTAKAIKEVACCANNTVFV